MDGSIGIGIGFAVVAALVFIAAVIHRISERLFWGRW